MPCPVWIPPKPSFFFLHFHLCHLISDYSSGNVLSKKTTIKKTTTLDSGIRFLVFFFFFCIFLRSIKVCKWILTHISSLLWCTLLHLTLQRTLNDFGVIRHICVWAHTVSTVTPETLQTEELRVKRKQLCPKSEPQSSGLQGFRLATSAHVSSNAVQTVTDIFTF